MSKTQKGPKTPSSTFLAVCILMIFFSLFWAIPIGIGIGDMNESKLTHSDYQLNTYTFQYFKLDDSDDDSDPYYDIYVKELSEPLYIDNLFYDDELTKALIYLEAGETVSCYTKENGKIVELSMADGNTVLSLDAYNEGIYDNGLTMVIVFSVLIGIQLIIAIVMGCLYPRAKRREREIKERYRVRTVPTPKRRSSEDQSVISRPTFILLITLMIVLPIVFLVFLVMGLISLEERADGTAYLIAAFSSLGVTILLFATQYRKLTRYENAAFIKKLYETDMTAASLALDQDTLISILIKHDYNRSGNDLFYKVKKVYQNKTTQTHTYNAHFYTEEALAQRARSLEIPLPKEKATVFTHDILFVTVEDSLPEAMINAYRIVEYTAFYNNRSFVPILLHEGNLYFVKVGSTMRPYRMALNEALFLVGLL